jgi:hypothetical protein
VSPDLFLATVLVPGLDWLAQIVGPVPAASREARVLMLAIAGQESNWSDRVQSRSGTAHGHWQMERGGGVAGVLHHPASEEMAQKLCDAAHVTPEAVNVWGIFASPAGDRLAAAFARLLLFTDPLQLPPYGDAGDGGIYYRRNWRPGKWRPADWPIKYEMALRADKAWEARRGITA